MSEDPNAYQIGGTHYQGRKMQPWDIIEAWDLDFFEGSALAYLLRANRVSSGLKIYARRSTTWKSA